MSSKYRYSMVIQWHEPDKIFVVTVPELPGCRTHGRTYEEALQQAQDAIETWLMPIEGEPNIIPPPSIVVDGNYNQSEVA